MMDEGIFKTKRTGLVGSRRVDFQLLLGINERAERLKKACRPPRHSRKQEVAANQLRAAGHGLKNRT